jgi:hypothetical protein
MLKTFLLAWPKRVIWLAFAQLAAVCAAWVWDAGFHKSAALAFMSGIAVLFPVERTNPDSTEQSTEANI